MLSICEAETELAVRSATSRSCFCRSASSSSISCICVLQEKRISARTKCPEVSQSHFPSLPEQHGRRSASDCSFVPYRLSAVVEFPHLLNHLAVDKRLHILRRQCTGTLAAPIVCPLLASQVSNAVLSSQGNQRISASATLDFPGQPCIMAFPAILKSRVLWRAYVERSARDGSRYAPDGEQSTRIGSSPSRP